MNKTKNNTFVLDIKSNQKDQCAEFNCIKLGEYKAPFSRKNINTYSLEVPAEGWPSG